MKLQYNMITGNLFRRFVPAALLVLCLFSMGCQKMLDVNSTRAVGEENMWNTMEDSRAALMGLYGLTRAALVDNNAHWVYGDVRAGEFKSPNRPDLRAVIANDLTASYASIDALSNWRRFYAAINAANIFLERIHEVKEADRRYTDNNLTVDIAQARFLRAFCYFYMVRVWGDVPLIISSHDGAFENKPRDDQDKVMAWAEQELLAAAADLPYRYSVNDEQQLGNYYNEDGSRWNGALARKLSAYGVLAHLAAWQRNYSNVATYTDFVLTNFIRANNNYVTTSHLTDANGFFFDKRNNQLLSFHFQWSYADHSFAGHLEELTLAAPIINKSMPDIYLPKDSILSIFSEAKDERFSLDTLGYPSNERYFTNFNGKYPIFSKIKCIMGGSTTNANLRTYSSAVVFTRLEDLTLLRAEALAVLGDRNGAIENLNVIRDLRGMEPYDEEISGTLLEAIFRERQRELMGEGHRWYDLVRYHRIKRHDPGFTQLIEQGGIYWPLSQSLTGQNTLLEQTEYWQK
ncbi:RagB/SusD family nutrient uptake outer membrane protein [Parapedobacter sp. 10938]|uniref:RagB/SusD family nutrient uptake outer membrane protein n=1 Tax=Parapedobacter flavus TaxID=3110225 RepID=UPI002DB8FE82|nr:RagB/SusD family nutrient uptake outer membrane protein [Parapedobacter sp. 10938]MEC3881123.1 RagB/SusD family nutrient uptake outer membrane protein [Parapedobacter sp. 10938]